MAEAAVKERPKTIAELDRLVKDELEIAEVVAKINYAKVGAYLTELKALVPVRQWKRHLHDKLDLSLGRAGRYMKRAAEVRAYQEGRGPKPAARITPQSKHPEDQHHARGYGAWNTQRKAEKAEQQQPPPRSRHDTDQARADKPRVRELGFEMIEAGFKVLAQKYHPDRGSTDKDSFRLLPDARARLRRGNLREAD